MTNVTFMHEAEVELWDAVAYYEDKAAGLGLDFEAEIERSIQIVSKSPKCWPVRKDNTRRFLIRRFPYLVVYTYHNKHIWIIALAHCRRHPEYWVNRV